MAEHDLPNSELDVMGCLWQGQPRTAREIRDALQAERPLSHSSVCTLLARLEAKGFVAREKGSSGKAFVYRATAPPTRTRRRLVSDFVNRVFAGSGVDLVATLLESQPPTEQQLNDLQNLLDELRKQKRSRGVARGGASQGNAGR